MQARIKAGWITEEDLKADEEAEEGAEAEAAEAEAGTAEAPAEAGVQG